MKNLEKFIVTLRKTENRNYIGLEAIVPNSEIGKIDFFMYQKDFNDFANSRRESFSDIGHRLFTFGDHCNFYNMELVTKPHGTTNVNYAVVDFPIFARKIIAKAANLFFNKANVDDKKEIHISTKCLERWSRQYGQGSGSTKIEFTSSAANELFELNIKNESFKNKIDYLLKIAKNCTNHFWEKGILELSKDWDGFFFQLPGLHGGIINHGSKEKPDWSIHT